MDKFNVINQTQDLQSLEQDMVKWSMMPHKYRMMSDDDCQRLHGMSNTDYYNKIKAKFLSNPDMENIQEGAVEDKMLFSFDDFEDRLIMSANLQQTPDIVIIDPWWIDGDIIKNSYSLEDLQRKYRSFLNLSERNRLFSNEYSFSIWGYNVVDMYNIMKSILTDDNIVDDDFMEAVSYEIKPLKRTVESFIFDDDKISLCQVLSNLESAKFPVNEMITDKDTIISAIESKDYISHMPAVVPYLTVDEMNIYAPDSDIGTMSYNEWYTALKEASISGDDNAILNLGWYPSIPFTEKMCNIAKQRQQAWLEKYCPRIIDIRDIGDDIVINEASRNMIALYEQKNLFPVYIVSSWTNTTFGKLERIAIKNAFYSHAGMSLDSNLKSIFTFKFNRESNGFDIESIEDYKKASDKAYVSVICIFVNSGTRNKLNDILKNFAKNRKNTKYNFGNLINILLGRAKEFPYPENMQLVCSQFVDTVLKLVNIDVTNKPSNLVIPQDLAEISSQPKVYKVYEGLASGYKESKVEKDIRALFERDAIQNIKYKDPIDISMGEHAKAILNDLLTPTAAIVERKLPVRFTGAGDLTIDLLKSLEQQYQESHKLLTGYGENNLDGIKHELAHMYSINSVIENKIKRMKKGDTKYNDLIKLRARVLNDFKKYFKIVVDKEPKFDFSKYYQNSEYYNGSITIDNKTMKYSGKLIKQFLKAQGI